MRHLMRLQAIAVASLIGALVPAGVAQALPVGSAGHRGGTLATGGAWPLPGQPPPAGNLALLSSPAGQGGAQVAARRAVKTGRPVAVPGLTTPTSSVTAEPDGHLVADSTVLPVRVRRGRGWVPVDTRLRRGAGGRLVPVAVPGDTVSFSGGGSGPATVLSVPGSRLALSWRGPLPPPVVSGASATYRNVLPGVDLVLTATSTAAGGFSEALVVRSRAAAADPRLAQIGLRVSAPGTRGLHPVPGGGLAAVMTGGRGSFTAPAPEMWDSASGMPRSSVMRTAVASARAVGAGLAAMGSGPGPVPGPLGPAGGSRLAPVTARVLSRGQVLALVPDARMLASRSTRFPVFLGGSFTSLTADGNRLDYDPVQSDDDNGGMHDVNCTGPHWNSPGWSPVGYDDFEAGYCQFSDTDRALYRLSLPDIFDDHLVVISASLQATEVYGSDCVTVPLTASLIDAIHPSTGWPGPNRSASNVDATATMPVDNGSCGGTQDTQDRVSTGFNVTPDLRDAGGWPNITFRIWEPDSTNEDDHVQLTDSPVLQITYTDTPDTPSNLAEDSVSTGVGQVGCDTTEPSPDNQTNPAPAVSGDPYLLGVYGDEDGAAVRGKIQYWDFTDSGPVTTNDDAIDSATTSEGQVGYQLPSSFVSGLPDGTVVAWQAKSVTGSGTVGGNTYGPYYSPYSDTCYFAVYPNGPSTPKMSAPPPDQTTAQQVGTSLPFTITPQGTDPISEFTWSMDGTPPSPASASPAQTCVAGTAEPACTVTGGVATLTVTVPAPGPHELNVCAWDAGGNSACTDGAPSGATATFTGEWDTPVSYTSGSSLQANFVKALGGGASYDNTMISTQAGSPGNANGDGGYRTIDESVLDAAGWAPGGTVTVDGASFPLPDYGTSSSGPDNLLAANQTIGAGSSGSQGNSALVFLATATYADVVVPGLATGSPDSIPALQGDPTAPAVMGGVPVAGSWCAGQAAFNATSTACQPATGKINYAGNCITGDTSTYTLTVPDWTAGPSDIAALSMADQDRPSGEFASPANLYAFSVPVNPACTVQSVTLPDVSASVRPTVASGVSQPQPALHIFGMALRNTSTATPLAGGSAKAAPAQQGWTGAFESPTEGAYGPPAGSAWGNQTIRVVLSPNTIPAAGGQVRVRLSNPGFLSGDGTGPLQIGDATIGVSDGGAGVQQLVWLTFDQALSVTVPVGGDVYSDPKSITVTAGQQLVVSLYLENSSIPYLPENTWSSGAQTWLTATGAGDKAGQSSGSAFSTGPEGMVPLLTGVDVTTQGSGEPTVVVAGNNVIDANSTTVPSDAANAPSQRLAGQLSTTSAAAGFGVVDAGVEANQVLSDGTAAGGVSLLARVDRDILAEPNVGTVVIDEGLEDLLLSAGSTTTEQEMQNAYGLLATQLADFGITVVTANLTPCTNYQGATDSCPDSTSSGVQNARIALNAAIGQASCPADINSAVAVPDSQTGLDDLAAGDGTADNVNLTLGATSGGYNAIAQALAQTVGSGTGPPCSLAAYLYPQTS
jgi:hypothetical protein